MLGAQSRNVPGGISKIWRPKEVRSRRLRVLSLGPQRIYAGFCSGLLQQGLVRIQNFAIQVAVGCSMVYVLSESSPSGWCIQVGLVD